MLLVDDRQRQGPERDLFLHQCVRAHHQMHVASRDRRQQRAAFCRRDPPAQQRHAKARRRQPARQVPKCCSARISVGAMNAA